MVDLSIRSNFYRFGIRILDNDIIIIAGKW